MRLTISNYPYLFQSDSIKDFCKNLFERNNLNYFQYEKCFDDGGRIILTSNLHWIMYYFSQEYYRNGYFDNHQSFYTTSIILWRHIEEEAAEIYQQARNLFSIGDGITLLVKKSSTCEMFHFGSQPKHPQKDCSETIFNLQKFACEFSAAYSTVIQDAEQTPIFYPTERALIPMVQVSPATLSNDLFKFNRYYYGDVEDGKYLTPKEYGFAEKLMQGHTIKQAAELVQISRRTADIYVARLKEKTGCYSIFQLGMYLRKYVFCE